ncbi:hypothetical protein FRC19_007720 [Serendipita sp. 401]|nr:hypothetical protein FRC19_007720 [Serendipita sp. 401]
MSDQDKIILYDIPSRLTPMAWSPNTWKARYVLNHKRLPYETVWVPYTEIASLWAELGLEPITDGSIPFTTFLPVISVPPKDGRGPRTAVAESFNIALYVSLFPSSSYLFSSSSLLSLPLIEFDARYLDRAFPETPRVIPPHTAALHSAFIQALSTTLFVPLRPIMIPQIPLVLADPLGAAYFTRTREKTFFAPAVTSSSGGSGGVKLAEVSPRGSEKRKADMENAKKALQALDRIFKANQGEQEQGETNKEGKSMDGWIMGSVGPTFADFAIGAIFRWIQSVEDVVLVPDGPIGEAEKGELWSLIRSIDEGRWAKYAERFREWEQVI